MRNKVTGIIIYGPNGSGKTTMAIKLAGTDYILDHDISFGSLISGKTIIIDNADLLQEKDLEVIVKHTRGNLILTCTDLGKIPKGIKVNLNKIRAGLVDKRKEQTQKLFPNSDNTLSYNSNIFRVLENVYGSQDRYFVDDMLNELKPNTYMLLKWMAENGDGELLHYIDEKQLFKVNPKFLYSTVAHGVPVRSRRIKWPNRHFPDKGTIDFMREHGLRMADAILLKDIVEKKKVYIKKKTKPRKEEAVVIGGSDRW